MKVEDTCTPKCAYYKKFMSKGQKSCPHFIETTWASKTDPRPKIAQDCASKRAVILQIDLFNRLLGLQQAAEQERNLQHKMLVAAVKMAKLQGLSLPQIDVEDVVDAKLIEDKRDEVIG